ITSIMLSFTMGLAFLAMGFNQGEMSPVLSMMWGSILFVRLPSLILMAVLALILVLFLYLCSPSMDSMLFSRSVSRVSGLNEKRLLLVFMFITALIITVNLQIVGGLLIYSLLTNPAATAFVLGKSMKSVRRWAVLSGMASTLGGLWISYVLDLSTGACIVLVSTALYSLALIINWRFRKYTSH
ncbi:MAG: metal ABC transporter permease, partial [Candidatus Hydrogenedens sp.]|nr:metal ABC transporter permease [Candidatus Hydrogenedens sp.]